MPWPTRDRSVQPGRRTAICVIDDILDCLSARRSPCVQDGETARPNRETILGLNRKDFTDAPTLALRYRRGRTGCGAGARSDPPPDGTPTRVRGTVEKLDDHNLTVKSRDGQSLSITLAPDVDIITLVKKSLADIKPGDFVASTGVRIRTAKFTQSRLASPPKRRLMAAGIRLGSDAGQRHDQRHGRHPRQGRARREFAQRSSITSQISKVIGSRV